MRPTSQFLYDMIHKQPQVKFNLSGSTPPNLFTADELAIHTSLSFEDRNDAIARFNSKKLQLLGLSPDRHAITFSCGSSQAFTQALASVTMPGDTVVIESPTYEPFVKTALFLGLKIKFFKRSGFFETDFKSIKKLAGKRRVLILTNPHFPLGGMYAEKELRKLASLFKHMVVDEVFLPLFTVGRGTSFTNELPANVFATGSYSKSMGLSSLRVGWIASHKKFAEALERIGYHLQIEMPLPSLMMAERALEKWGEKIQQLENLARPNRLYLLNWLRMRQESNPRFKTPFSHDLTRGHFAMIRVPVKATRLVSELVKDDIFLRDGTVVGLPKHARINWLIDENDFKVVWKKVSARLR